MRGRQRGRIEERGGSLRVAVYAGIDPVTGKRRYLRKKVNGTTTRARPECADDHRLLKPTIEIGYSQRAQ